MTKRFLAVTAVVALIACRNQPRAAETPKETIACALGGARQFLPQCSVERTRQDGAELIVVHLPGGGFHRLQVSPGGQHLDTADGADQTRSARKGDRFEVILGEDRYVIPVQMTDRRTDRRREPHDTKVD